MRLNLKLGIYAAIAAVLVGFAAFGVTVNAEIDNIDDKCVGTGNAAGTGPECVYLVTEHGIDSAPGTSTAQLGCDKAAGASRISAASTLIVANGSSILICVNTVDFEDSKLTFDSNDVGVFSRASCGPVEEGGGSTSNDDGDVRVAEWPDDACIGTSGSGTDHLIIEEETGSSSSTDNGLGTVIVRFTCPTTGGTANITITHGEESVATGATAAGNPVDSFAFNVSCRGQAGGLTLTATPTTVEIIPALSNTSHSLIQVTLTDSAGTAILIAPGTEIDFTTDRCAIEESGVNDADKLATARASIAGLSTANPATYAAWEALANTPGTLPDTTAPQSDQTVAFDITIGTALRSMAAAILHCDPHASIANATPGVANVLVCIDVVGAADICRTVTVTVIGPPASITVAASPTTQRCGEKSTITVTVRDAIGQNVSDHTRVEMVTNLGGVLAGTGAVAGFAGPVVPISSTVAGTFGGVATAFLLTSETHSGPYEVVATTGGTTPGDPYSWGSPPGGTVLGGVFSTAPISAQVTVTCTLFVAATAAPATPAPTITAPRTGTGITPPNTGDAGLASDSSAWTLFAIGGLAAFALAGLATARFARR